jgi:2,3-bisphosphoglycerate-independent phosphoglycerate mutase
MAFSSRGTTDPFMSVKQLEEHPSFPGVEGPVLVVVMDGVGIGRRDEGDAVWVARTPNLDALPTLEGAVTTSLAAHGTAVGLPSDGDMGNSEVGHNALGAGCVHDQGAKRVALAIESGEIFEGQVWKDAVARVLASGEPLHFIGLLSDGNVHSHQDHLHAMLRRAAEEGVQKVRVHALLDGRDVGERSAPQYVAPLEALLKELSQDGRDYRVASGGGRMTTTMDRYEADWSMVERGWNAHVHGRAERTFGSLSEAVQTLYAEDPKATDQFLPAFVITEGDEPAGPIRDGASVLFFNFRGDRALEITRAFTEDGLSAFDRGDRPDVFFAGMMQYDGDLKLPEHFLVDPPTIDRTLGEYLAKSGVPQFACSETQKYGHVTYFWNGNRSGKFDQALEEYVEVPSDNVPFEQRPWMKAAEIADATLAAIEGGKARHLRINFANGDMVGHTGHFEASVIAVECVDLQLGRLMDAIQQAKGAILITADHGNADQMYDLMKDGSGYRRRPDGSLDVRTSHSLNPVPCHLWAPGHGLKASGVERPGLANVAATVLQLLGYAKPDHMEPSLLG